MSDRGANLVPFILHLVRKEETEMKIFTKYITLKNGKRIYAANYGLKAFCIEVRDKEEKKSA